MKNNETNNNMLKTINHQKTKQAAPKIKDEKDPSL